MTVTLGVDPGKTGAVAVFDAHRRLAAIVDMPVTHKIVDPTRLNAHVFDTWMPGTLTVARPLVAVIEDVHAMPRQGVSTTFSFGRSLGVVEGVLAAQGCRLHYVSPGRWKRALGLSSDKGASRRRAIELWPEHAAKFARVRDDGRAEAALIAHWWHTVNPPQTAAAPTSPCVVEQPAPITPGPLSEGAGVVGDNATTTTSKEHTNDR